MSKSNRLKPLLFAISIIAIIIIVRVLPVKEYLTVFLDWVQGVGPLGMLAFGAVYVLACILFIPGSILTLGAGLAFGVIWGTIAVSLSSVVGATAAFILGRTLAREAIEGKVSGNAKFAAIDKAVATNGFKIVLLTRLSPVFPFNLLNYSFGLTNVSLKNFFFASWIGMFPGTVMYVYIGSLAGSLAAAGERARTPAEWTLYIVGLIATVIVTVFVTRIARKALNQAVPGENIDQPVNA